VEEPAWINHDKGVEYISSVKLIFAPCSRRLFTEVKAPYPAARFIGLGAMGKHMAARLAAKLPPNSKLFVYDVVKGLIDELITKFPGKVIASASPRDVAKNTVWDSVPFFSPMDGQRSSPFVLLSLALSFLRWE
jgi:hypothetical protein